MSRSLALEERWWIDFRNRQPVRGALERAFLYHWSEQVEAGLKANRDSDRSPGSWEELGGLLRADSKPAVEGIGLDRLATPLGQLAVAQLLGREIMDLTPSIERWLRTAVADLLDLPADDESVARYVVFRLMDSSGGGADPKEAVDQARRLEASDEKNVRRIATGIDEVLQRAGDA